MSVSAAHRIVYLERSTLDAEVRRPSFAHEWVEYPDTAADQLLERLQGATIVVSNKLAIPRAVLEQLPQLQMIAIAATGANHIDLDCCRERGVRVCNVRDYSRHTLPEHVFMLLLALRRQLPTYHAKVAEGAWQKASRFYVEGPALRDLHGSTLGIVGRGMIGAAVARLAEAFGMRVLFAEHRGATSVRDGHTAFDEVVSTCDALTLHCPLTDATRHLIGARELAAMKPGALLINTARGALVDAAALAQALRAGRLAGAGVDVLEEEPPANGNPLLEPDIPNIIVTPHVAWSGAQAKQLLADGLIANLEAFARGEPRNLVV